MGGFAWVTLATNDSYSLGALVLGHSLKRAGTVHQLAILITPGVTEAMRTQLSAVFNVVKEVDVLDSRDTANLALLARPELGITFTKLHCWRLTQYDKCVFLDADTLVLENCDELFDREELSAAPDVGWPDCFNSGVFVYKPSEETFKSISDFALVHGTFDGGDQGLLNLYFSDWATKDIAKHLPFVYNVVSSVTYSYLPALKQFRDKLKIIHFIGATKPWLQPFDTETGLSRVSADSATQSQSDFIQLWWNLFCANVHPSLSANMAGLAGALATVKLGSPLSEEQHALKDHLRRQGWEEGQVDYMGRDSFDNIWAKICETLSTGPSPVSPIADLPQPGESKPAETQASATEKTPPREVRVEARRTSVPKAEKALETLFLKPNTMLQPTSETADPLTPPPFLIQPPFAPASAPDSKTDDAKLAESTSCPLPPKPQPESPACPLPPKQEPESPACPVPPKPQPESPACPVPPKPQPESPACPVPTKPQPESPACPVPPKPQPESPVCPLPPKPQPESPVCPLPPKPQPESPVCPLPPKRQPESPVCPLPPKPDSTLPAQPTEPTSCPLPKPVEPAAPAATPAAPAAAPAAPEAAPASPEVTAPVASAPVPSETAPAPSECPIKKPDASVAPIEQTSCPKPTVPQDVCPLPPKTESFAAPVESAPAKEPSTDACPVKKSEVPPPALVKEQAAPSSQLPETPPQSPSQQPEGPKSPVQSQPSTPTVTTATPPLSPPPVPSDSPVSAAGKLSVQTDIPQTPPVDAAAPPVVPQASSAAAPSDEPPIPPKRKGGRGGGGDQGKGGRGGKGGKGKK